MANFLQSGRFEYGECGSRLYGEMHRTVKATVGQPAPLLSIAESGWGYLIWVKGRVDPMNVNKDEVHDPPEFEQ